ncbi:unnamed protein product [Colias eurytheme]|nr:unnamed protein product [Colias eurytheme]
MYKIIMVLVICAVLSGSNAYNSHRAENSCGSRGGECFPIEYNCPEILTYTEAIDCEQEHKCCILVK